MKNISFSMSLSVDLPKKESEKLIKAIETFIGSMSRVMPLPEMNISVTETAAEGGETP